MSKRLPVPAAPAPLESYADHFDPLFAKRTQRASFRCYLEGLLLPAERNKTLTGLANSEPIVGAQNAQVQRLQWFVSEATWDADAVNQQRLALLRTDPLTAPTEQGVLVIDETGDRKDGTKTAFVGRQYLGSIGKIDNGVVSVSSLWADEHLYYPLEVEPYTPAQHFPRGKADPNFRTKPQLALALVAHALAAQIPFRAVVADCFYGEHVAFKAGLDHVQVGYVLALKPSHSWWHRVDDLGSLWEVAQSVGWAGPEHPGRWVEVPRVFRDGHCETWWAVEIVYGPYGRTQGKRAVVATTDPEHLPDLTTWYLTTNVLAPQTRPTTGSALAEADVAEVVRLYALRTWVEQSYKQVKGALGWTDYQVRSAVAIRRHWTLVWCAFSFCWWHASHTGRAEAEPTGALPEPDQEVPAAMKPAGREKISVKLGRSLPLTWPRALRAVRAWLEPWTLLWRYWRAWSPLPPPPELHALLESVYAGKALYLYDPG